MIRALRWAAAFLTVAPVAPRGPMREGELARAAAFFPLVGAAVGLACWGVDLACTGSLPPLLRGVLVVAAAALLSRGLHLDGLADTADGLGSLRDRAGMLAIMRDPHVGAFGAGILLLVLLCKVVCIAEIPSPHRLGAIVASATGSRLSMALGGWLFRYARRKGTGSGFVGRVRLGTALAASLFAVACAGAAGGLASLGTLGVGAAVGLSFSGLVALRLRGATGDTLGASGELAETAALLWVVASTHGVQG